MTPQHEIQHSVTGAAGKLRKGDLDRRDPLIAAGYDEDCHFMPIESDGLTLRFKAINSQGATIDEGSVPRPQSAAGL